MTSDHHRPPPPDRPGPPPSWPGGPPPPPPSGLQYTWPGGPPPQYAGPQDTWSSVPLMPPDDLVEPERPPSPQPPDWAGPPPAPAPGGGAAEVADRLPDPDASTGMWIWITEDQAELIRLRSVVRSARRFSAALLLGGLVTLPVLGFLAGTAPGGGSLTEVALVGEALTGAGVADRLALAAFALAAGVPALLLVAHLHWWRHALAVRRLDRHIYQRTAARLAHARRRRTLERLLVTAGWVALLAAVRESALLVDATVLDQPTATLLRAATWAWPLAAAVAGWQAAAWLHHTAMGDDDAGGGQDDDTPNWWTDPVGSTLHGPRLRRARWTAAVFWTLTLAGTAALYAVWLGLWALTGAALLAVLATPLAALLATAWSGRRFDREERRAAQAMPKHTRHRGADPR